MTLQTPTAGVLLPGLGIGGYRSLRDLRYLAPLTKVTLLAGQNNVGKSNVIRFVERYLQASAPLREWEDEPRPAGERLRVATAHRLDEKTYDAWVGHAKDRTDRFLALPSFHPTDDDLFWVVWSQNNENRHIGGNSQGRVPWHLDPDWVEGFSADAQAEGSVHLGQLRQGLFSTTGGGPADNIKAVVEHLFPWQPPRIELIRAFRQVTKATDPDHSGSALIETLADHQNPNVQERDKRDKFDAINEFLRSILEDPSVGIEIPAQRDYIMVHQGGWFFRWMT